jgi:hypothetical protein
LATDNIQTLLCFLGKRRLGVTADDRFVQNTGRPEMPGAAVKLSSVEILGDIRGVHKHRAHESRYEWGCK